MGVLACYRKSGYNNTVSSRLSVSPKRITCASNELRLGYSMPCSHRDRKSPAMRRSRVFARNGKTLTESNPSQPHADLWANCEIISERAWAGLSFSSDSSLADVSQMTWGWGKQFRYWRYWNRAATEILDLRWWSFHGHWSSI